MVVPRNTMVLWSTDNGYGIIPKLPELMKVFRGTGGMCEIAKEEDFPSILTSAICKSSGGAWNGGHDLVCPYKGFSLQSRVVIYFYLLMLPCLYGGRY